MNKEDKRTFIKENINLLEYEVSEIYKTLVQRKFLNETGFSLNNDYPGYCNDIIKFKTPNESYEDIMADFKAFSGGNMVELKERDAFDALKCLTVKPNNTLSRYSLDDYIIAELIRLIYYLATNTLHGECIVDNEPNINFGEPLKNFPIKINGITITTFKNGKIILKNISDVQWEGIVRVIKLVSPVYYQ